MGKEEIECVLCKTYSHPVLSVTAIMLPLPSLCLWHVAHGSSYILSIIMLHALTTLICKGNASTKKCSVVGGSRDPIMLTSEHCQIEYLIVMILYADSRRELRPERQP